MREARPDAGPPDLAPEALREDEEAEGAAVRRPEVRIGTGSARRRWNDALGPSAGRAG